MRWFISIIFLLISSTVLKFSLFSIASFHFPLGHYFPLISRQPFISSQQLLFQFFFTSIPILVLRVLRVVRFFRILRPLKALRYFKGILVFVESLAQSMDILLITTGIFMTTMVALAFLTNSFIGDLLVNRCLPRTEMINGTLDILVNSSARSNVNYIAYGVNYFYSTYNLDYCKDK